jgi:hypothetical protein
MSIVIRNRGCIALLLILCLARAGMAEKLRPANPAEEKVIAQYSSVMTHILDQMLTDDWQEEEGKRYTFDDVLVNSEPDRPLDVNCLLERRYDARADSERFRRVLAPLMEKMEQQSDVEAKARIGSQVQALMHLAVSVHFNRTNVGIDPALSQNRDLGIPGVDRTYKVRDDSFGHGSAYVLLFGNWQRARWDADNGWLHFVFAHPNGTPYIENIEIRLYGADDRIQEMLHMIDWKQVNEAMTG